jgi:hypothetical protein
MLRFKVWCHDLMKIQIGWAMACLMQVNGGVVGRL